MYTCFNKKFRTVDYGRWKIFAKDKEGTIFFMHLLNAMVIPESYPSHTRVIPESYPSHTRFILKSYPSHFCITQPLNCRCQATRYAATTYPHTSASRLCTRHGTGCTVYGYEQQEVFLWPGADARNPSQGVAEISQVSINLSDGDVGWPAIVVLILSPLSEVLCHRA